MKTMGLRLPPEILRKALENMNGAETSATEISEKAGAS